MRALLAGLLACAGFAAPADELDDALKLQGDPLRGRLAYEVCQGCHRPDGSGREDGTYPRLAGQLATILIKQLTDIRGGRRDNPRMHPFAGQRMVSVQEVADIAVFLQGLPPPPDVGKGSGTALELGAGLYSRDCLDCHGPRGEGDALGFYPQLAGQHYAYLVRQTREIRDGTRRNANRDMAKLARRYSDAEVEAVADYLSRLLITPPK